VWAAVRAGATTLGGIPIPRGALASVSSTEEWLVSGAKSEPVQPPDRARPLLIPLAVSAALGPLAVSPTRTPLAVSAAAQAPLAVSPNVSAAVGPLAVSAVFNVRLGEAAPSVSAARQSMGFVRLTAEDEGAADAAGAKDAITYTYRSELKIDKCHLDAPSVRAARQSMGFVRLTAEDEGAAEAGGEEDVITYTYRLEVKIDKWHLDAGVVFRVNP